MSCRRALSVCILLILAWPAPALEPEEARYLLSRTGFGWTQGAVDELLPLSRAEAVDLLLTREPDPLEPPAWVADEAGLMAERQEIRELERGSPEQVAARRQMGQDARRRGQELQAWWATRMLHSRNALHERLVLHWHGHFTSSLREVRDPLLMWRQQELFRDHALGDFRELLQAVAVDPAMLVYLDGARNHRRAPNENFAREVMELFTLGEGHYSEADIREGARAATGWTVDRLSGTAVFRPRLHDPDAKTVLGQRVGNLQDFMQVLLEHPRSPEYMAERLWAWYGSGDADPATQAAVAAALAEDWQLIDGLRALLISDAFWHPAQRGARIKDPADLLIGTLRALDYVQMDGRSLAQAMAGLGQQLFHPPSVQGWPGGSTWIDARSLLMRRQILLRMVESMDESRHPAQPAQLFSLPPDDSPANLADALLHPYFQVH